MPSNQDATPPRRSQRAPLLWLALPFMAGLTAGRLAPQPSAALPLGIALTCSGLALGLTGRRGNLWAPCLAAAMVASGDASYLLHFARNPSWDTRPEREARLVLRADQVYPSSRPGRTAGLAMIAETEPHLREYGGQRLYFSLRLRPRDPAPIRSARLTAVGVLAVVPRHPAAGTMDARLSSLGLNFKLSRGRIVQIGPPNRYYRRIEILARRLNELLAAGFERRPDLGGIYRAMMLGEKSGLGPVQRESFMRSGTMHLFAINGLHIDIVAVTVHALLAALRVPGLAACGLLLGVLWLDVSATGNSPSAMRAFGMVGSAAVAAALRRPRNSLAALAAAALVAVLVAPMDFFGASFQMSYAVVVVLLTFGLPLSESLLHRYPVWADVPLPDRTRGQRLHAAVWRWLLGAAGLGTAAGLVGAVTGVEFFGLFAPVGLAANLVIAPLAALVIVAGVAALAAGLSGCLAACRFFNGAARVVLLLIRPVVGGAAGLPGAYFSAQYRAPWIGSVALALLVAACLAGHAGGWRRAWGGFWVPVGVVAATLVFGAKFG